LLKNEAKRNHEAGLATPKKDNTISQSGNNNKKALTLFWQKI